MKQVNSLKFWHGLLFMLMMVSFTACVDVMKTQRHLFWKSILLP